jgi:hypothetical protein
MHLTETMGNLTQRAQLLTFAEKSDQSVARLGCLSHCSGMDVGSKLQAAQSSALSTGFGEASGNLKP